MDQDYGSLASIDYGSVLGREHFMDPSIRPLWPNMPRIAGPAFTVQLAPGDNLMLHAAIYEAPAGSIIVIDGVDDQYAVAGGNVCAVAQRRGILGFVIDGVIRDLEDITRQQFPVFCHGVFPVPGGKACYSELNQPVNCGGIKVNGGDIIVADAEGIVVLPPNKAPSIWSKAEEKRAQEVQQSLDEWENAHRAKIDAAIPKAKR